jgi:outer membrane protein insertion porin family
MMRRGYCSLAALLCVVCLLGAYGSHAQELAAVITAVEVSGNQRFDTGTVLSNFGLEVGDRVDQVAIAEGIRRLYSLRVFSDVEVEAEPEPERGGVRLIIIVLEHPTLAQLELRGNRAVSSGDIEKELIPRTGQTISPQTVLRWKRLVLKLYEEKGYLLTTVTEEVGLPDDRGGVHVTLNIDEGRKVKIRDIDIKGNEVFSDEAIERNLTNREKEWYRSGSFKREELDEDLDKIVALYRKHGYVDCKVAEHRFRYDDQREWVTITIVVDEGQQYRVGSIEWVGNEALADDVLRSALKIGTGDIYNVEKVNETLGSLYAAYTEEGYLYVGIDQEESTQGDAIDIFYRIREGRPARIQKLVIAGNSRTKEKVIRRELVALPGEIFRRSSVIRSQQKVMNLGFFENVMLDYRTANEEGDVDLIFKVEEKQTGHLGGGFAYSEIDALTWYLELSEPNLFGRARRGYLRTEWGKRRQNYEFGFTEPWLFDRPISAGFDIFHMTRYRDYYDQKRTGGAVRASAPIPRLDYTRIYGTYRLEDVEIVLDPDIDERDLSAWFVEGKRRTSSAIFSLIRDSRDYVFNATRGSRLAYTIEVAGGPLGGQVDFHKHVLDARSYWPTFWKFVLMLRGRFGIVDGYSTASSVPSYEYFYLGGGGDYGIRGYPDPTFHPARDIAGRTMMTFTAEHKFLLTDKVYWLLFADAGNAWMNVRDIGSEDWKRGAGTGIRIEIPMLGVLGFDFGYGFDRKPKPRWEFHVQMGGAD